MRVIASLVLVLLLCVIQIRSHGYVNQPIAARQLKCSKAGSIWYPEDGSGVTDLACRQGFQYVQAKGNNPQYQFVQTNEYSMNIPNYANGYSALVAAVPSGLICSAGQSTSGNDKSGMSIAANWTPTIVSSTTGATSKNITISWCATATHNPSYWEFYVSKPTYVASNVLNWSDLDLLQTFADTQPQTTSDPTCSASKAYFFNINLPARYSNAVLVTRWQRIDPVGECFINCSDYVFSN